MYANGQGVQKDDAASIAWAQKAADQNFASAQYFLGQAYLQGRGVRQDNGSAAAWFRKAAEQGHAFAQYDLGVLYFRGHGVPENRVDAYKWIYLAAQRMQGDARAKAIETLDRVGGAMSRNERDHAVSLAQQWFRANPLR